MILWWLVFGYAGSYLWITCAEQAGCIQVDPFGPTIVTMALKKCQPMFRVVVPQQEQGEAAQPQEHTQP